MTEFTHVACVDSHALRVEVALIMVLLARDICKWLLEIDFMSYYSYWDYDIQ